MLTKYINLETFEITDDVDGFIQCDSEIAETIALLNKKGYKTHYSCAGHFDKLLYYEDSKPISEKSFFEENKELGLEIIRVTDDKIIYRGLGILSNLYILFAEKHNFSNLPEGFVFEDNNNIVRYFPLQDENGNKYTLNELKDIQKSSIEKLYEWAKSLQDINEKGDKYE